MMIMACGHEIGKGLPRASRGLRVCDNSQRCNLALADPSNERADDFSFTVHRIAPRG